MNNIDEQIDKIVFKLLSQGQYWGTGSGDVGKLDDNYKPDEPIDRTEGVQAIKNIFIEELKDIRGHVEFIHSDVLSDRIAYLTPKTLNPIGDK
jgi:hypothetical protein